MDVDPEVPVREQPETSPRPREDSYHSVRSDLREQRMNSLEQELHGVRQTLNNFIAMYERPPKESSKGDELHGSGYARTPRTYESMRSQPYVAPTFKTPPPSKAQPIQFGVTESKAAPQSREEIPEAGEQPKPEKAATLSPAYQNPEAGIWEQNYLSKALQQMKDSEIAKLRFLPGGNRPFEFEKWLSLISTTLNGMHPEIGSYWKQVVDSSTEAYQK